LRKKTDELIGTASGTTPATAFIAAKRKMANQIVEQYANDLLKLPQLRGRLNTKTNTRSELVSALNLAVAYNIKDTKRIEYEPRCKLVYIALSASKKNVVTDLRNEENFADHLNFALNGQMDQLESAAFKKDNQTEHKELDDSEKLLTILNETAKQLNPADFLEKDMINLTNIRMNSLKKTSENIKTITFRGDRDTELIGFRAQIAEAGRVGTAVKDFKKRDYISAIEIFQRCARDSDPNCQFIVAIMYLRALGAKKNVTESLIWLKKAAEAEHALAKLFLGIYTFAGIGTPADPQTATKWINQAFNEGWTCDIEIKSCAKDR